MTPPNADTPNDDASPGDGPPFDPDRLVATLARHDVDYLLVGGMGARLHGATRLTKDLDCLPRFDEANTLRLATAMRELHARLRVANMSDAESIELTSHLPAPDFFARGEISNWMTDAGPLDVLHDMPDRDGRRLSYDQLVERADTHSYSADITVVVAGLADIVASKEYANRDKDHEALPELRQILGREAAGPEPSPRPDRGNGGCTPTNRPDHPGGIAQPPEYGAES